MRLAVLLAFALAGCMTSWDPHAPATIVAGGEGGSVTVPHGSRLRLPLAADPAGAYEWRRVEPQVLIVTAERPADAEGQTFTPVRTGDEKLRLEYRPLAGDGPAQRTVSYDVSVPEETGIFSRFWSALRRRP
jgi:hypothetical protein